MAVKVYPAASAATGGALPDWSNTSFPATGYAVGDKVVDTTIMETFRCIVAHIPTGTSLPPSQDPTNWKGNDEKDIGKVVTMGHMRDAGPLLAMTPGRTISRTKYKRLLEAIAPQKTNVQITNGSNIMLLDAGQDADIPIGAVIEMAGVPAGAMVIQKTTPGSKVATVDAGVSRMFFRPGVIGTGYQIATPIEFTGPGEGGAGNGKVTATQADASGTVATVAGSTTITATPVTTVFNNAIVGDYVTGANFQANTRLTSFDGQVISSASAGVLAASNLLFMGTNFYSQINEGMLAGRQISSSPPSITPTALSATPIVSDEQTLPLNWSAVSGTGFFAPWDASALTLALLVSNRRVSVDATPAAQETYINAVNPAANRNGGTFAGQGAYFWQVGQAVLTQTVERRIGSNPAIPALAYVSAHTADAGQAANQINTNTFAGAQGAIYWNTGAGATGVAGQFLNIPTAGINQARVQSIQPEFSVAQAGNGGAIPQVYVQVGTPIAQFHLGQKVSGATAGLSTAANNFIDQIIPEVTGKTARLTAGSKLNLPVNDPQTLFSGHRYTSVAGGLLAGANNYLNTTAFVAQSTLANGNIATGSPAITFAPGSGIAAATYLDRFAQSATNQFPANSWVSSVTIDFNILNGRAHPTYTKGVFFPAATSLAGVVAGGRFTMATSFPGPAGGVVSGPAIAQFTANMKVTTGSNIAFTPVGFDWTKIGSGQQLSGTAPAGSHVGAPVGYSLPGATVGAYDTPLAKATTIPGQSIINVPVGWAPNVWTPVQGENVSVAAGIPATTTVSGPTNPEIALVVNSPHNIGMTKLVLDPGASVVPWTEGRYIQASGWPLDTRILATPLAGDVQVWNGNITAGSNLIYLSNASALPAELVIGGTLRIFNTVTGTSWPGNITVNNVIQNYTLAAWIDAAGTRVTLDDPLQTLAKGQFVTGTSCPITSEISPPRAMDVTVASVGATIATWSSGTPLAATDVGALINAPAMFPANTRILSIVGTTIQLDQPSISLGVATLQLGGTYAMGLSAPAVGFRGVQPTMSVGGWIDTNTVNPQGADYIQNNGALQLFTGPQVSLSAASVSFQPAGATVTLGKTIPISAAVAGATKFLDTALVTLGGSFPMLLNTTLAAANSLLTASATSFTFGPWFPTTNNAIASTMNAVQSAVFGASITLNNAATGPGGTEVITFGSQGTLNVAPTIPGTVTDLIAGPILHMSVAGTTANLVNTMTFGRWAVLDQNVTASLLPVAGGAATWGAVSSFQDAATGAAFTAPQLAAITTNTTPATFGAFATLLGTALATARSNIAAKVGAILQMATNNVTAANTKTITFGPVATLDKAATVTNATSSMTVGGHATVDIPFVSSNIDATYIFGIGVTMAQKIITGCSFSNAERDTSSSFNLSGNANAANFNLVGRSAQNTTRIKCDSTAGLAAGMTVSGSGFVTGTINSIIDGTTFTMSAAVTGEGQGLTLYVPANASVTSTTGTARFFPYGNGDGVNTFGIGVDASGRNLMVQGAPSGAGPKAIRPAGAATGRETHLQTAREGAVQDHTIVMPHVAGIFSNGAEIIPFATLGFTPTVLPVAMGGRSFTGDFDGKTPMPLVGPGVTAAMGLAIYAGAA